MLQILMERNLARSAVQCKGIITRYCTISALLTDYQGSDPPSSQQGAPETGPPDIPEQEWGPLYGSQPPNTPGPSGTHYIGQR